MVINDNSYFSISGFMVSRLNLKGSELLVYALIYSFSVRVGTEFFGTREYICKFTGLSVNTVDKCLKTLAERDLIIKMSSVSYKKSNVYTVNRDYVVDKEKGRTIKDEYYLPDVEKQTSLTDPEFSTLKKYDTPSPNLGSNNKEYTKLNTTSIHKSADEGERGNMLRITLGSKKIISMTVNQYGNLKSRMGESVLDMYVKRLERFLFSSPGIYVKSHYKTILKWHREDTEVEEFNPRYAFYK